MYEEAAYNSQPPFFTVKFLSITPETVRSNLLNLSQVVFEVTSACNFRCDYCSYGKLYLQDDNYPYKNEPLDFSTARALIDFLKNGWSRHLPPTPNQEVYVSFFGGEPLLNYELISKIVAYFERFPDLNRHFVFSMTTNGWLLDKYKDFLIEKDVRLLISLDGDKIENSYRVKAGGEQTHDKLIRNINALRETNPSYFEKRVMFNAVLHDRNSLSSAIKYFTDTFGKVPHLSPLASSNVNPEHLEVFHRMAQYNDSFETLNDEAKRVLWKEQFSSIPVIRDIIRDYFLNSGNVFRSYNELVFGKESKHYQTGTCTPFFKKLYLRSNGEILSCERIPSRFALGKVENGQVSLNFEEVSTKYRLWLEQLSYLCHKCARKDTCNQCIFQIDGFPDKTTCEGFITNTQYGQLRQRYFSILGKQPEIYRRIFDEVILL